MPVFDDDGAPGGNPHRSKENLQNACDGEQNSRPSCLGHLFSSNLLPPTFCFFSVGLLRFSLYFCFFFVRMQVWTLSEFLHLVLRFQS